MLGFNLLDLLLSLTISCDFLDQIRELQEHKAFEKKKLKMPEGKLATFMHPFSKPVYTSALNLCELFLLKKYQSKEFH